MKMSLRGPSHMEVAFWANTEICGVTSIKNTTCLPSKSMEIRLVASYFITIIISYFSSSVGIFIISMYILCGI